VAHPESTKGVLGLGEINRRIYETLFWVVPQSNGIFERSDGKMTKGGEQIGLHVQLACLWEATARKPGNVHRFRDFDDATYLDYLHSAAAIGPVLAEASSQSLGATILEAIRHTKEVTRFNTNLGQVLLLAPLAAVGGNTPFREGVEEVLNRASVEDSRRVYEAIRLARPSGLGRVSQEDIHNDPTRSLREVMALAADRDLVARQYAQNFREVFEEGVPVLQEGLALGDGLEEAIIFCYLTLLRNHPDSLIGRKQGLAVAEEACCRAGTVLAQGWPHQAAGKKALEKLDQWLRADGHNRNPGTTADLVAATLFVALRQGILSLPLTVAW
jgi:triphosphoribosyl-dephospho-CoA synthase